MRILRWLLGILVILVFIYVVGPSPSTDGLHPHISPLTISLDTLDDFLWKREKKIKGLKPDNEARIVWADEHKKEKTPYSIVYLHGFSASQGEGMPLHRELAHYYGCNLFLSRLEGHGIEDDSVFYDLTPQNYLESAKEAIAIGKLIGEKVIVVGTSTGAMFGLYLAADNPDIAALVMYSPLIDFKGKKVAVLEQPWGLKAGAFFNGSEYARFRPDLAPQRAYWSYKYRLEGIASLVALRSFTMKETVFSRVTCPTFLGYYYKDENNQDNTVSVNAMLDMFEELGTPHPGKVKVAFPDAGHHVITSKITSGSWQAVKDSTLAFLGNQLKLLPVDEVDDRDIQSAIVPEI